MINRQGFFALVRYPGTEDRFTVVQVSDDEAQVLSAMPTDHPDRGQWRAAATPEGVRYVAEPYSRSYALRVFRRLVAEGGM